MFRLYSFLALILLNVFQVFSFERELTVNIEPGSDTCFYHLVDKPGLIIDIEYQVIDGGHGDFDINFQLIEPSGKVMVADFKKSENIHRVTANIQGEYKFCFDNSISRINTKSVFFEIIVDSDNQNASDWDDNLDAAFIDNLSAEDYEGRIESLQDSVNSIRTNLVKAKHMQDLIRTQEARDRNAAEENFWRVNTWSIIQILVMIGVGIIQIIVVKSLFDDKSFIRRAYSRLQQ